MAKMAPAGKVHRRMVEALPFNARVAIAIVDDPYSSVGEKIQVVRMTRDDPLAGLHARRWIDDAQLEAGRLWQRYFEAAQIGSVRAIDPGKEAVDGGSRIPEPITDHQIKAMRKLDEAFKWLGKDGYEIIEGVIGGCQTLKNAAQAAGFSSARDVDYFSRRFKECLESLAELWGFVSKPVGKRVSV